MKKFTYFILFLMLCNFLYALKVEDGVGVKTITAGTAISVDPASGKGNVTINSLGGGLPLAGGASNYLQRFSTGTNYDLSSSTIVASSGSFVNFSIGSGGMKFNDGTTQNTAATTGVSITTLPIRLSFSGAVFIATSPFEAIPGVHFATHETTYTMTAITPYLVTGSSVGSTLFRVAISTDQGNSRTFTYLTLDNIEVSTGTTWGATVSTIAVINAYSIISLHITAVPGNLAIARSGNVVGTEPTGGGAIIRAWRKD